MNKIPALKKLVMQKEEVGSEYAFRKSSSSPQQQQQSWSLNRNTASIQGM